MLKKTHQKYVGVFPTARLKDMFTPFIDKDLHRGQLYKMVFPMCGLQPSTLYGFIALCAVQTFYNPCLTTLREKNNCNPMTKSISFCPVLGINI